MLIRVKKDRSGLSPHKSGYLATFEPDTCKADSAFADTYKEAVAVVADRAMTEGQRAVVEIEWNHALDYLITRR